MALRSTGTPFQRARRRGGAGVKQTARALPPGPCFRRARSLAKGEPRSHGRRPRVPPGPRYNNSRSALRSWGYVSPHLSGAVNTAEGAAQLPVMLSISTLPSQFSSTALLHDSTPARVGPLSQPPPSPHHGVGLGPAELGHPVEDVTPDHGLPSGRLRALTCIGRTRSQRAPAVGSPTPSATLVVRPYESSEEPLLAAPTGRPWAPRTPQSDEGGSRSPRPLYRPRRPDRRSTCGHRPRPP